MEMDCLCSGQFQMSKERDQDSFPFSSFIPSTLFFFVACQVNWNRQLEMDPTGLCSLEPKGVVQTIDETHAMVLDTLVAISSLGSTMMWIALSLLPTSTSFDMWLCSWRVERGTRLQEDWFLSVEKVWYSMDAVKWIHFTSRRYEDPCRRASAATEKWEFTSSSAPRARRIATTATEM